MMKSAVNFVAGTSGGEANAAHVDEKVDYTASELVYLARLKKIEREHRSIGATLDKRMLYRIEDTKIPLKERENRRGGINNASSNACSEDTSKSSKRQTEVVNKDLGGVKVEDNIHGSNPDPISSDFHNEELIWKTKSHSQNYASKRKYHYPELQDFYESLGAEKKADFQHRCREKVLDISRKLRKNYNLMKSEMNQSCVFHPEANTHRAHCLYIAKIYKAIRADTIEDPILRAMRAETISAQQAALEEQQRVQDHWSIETLDKKASVQDKCKEKGSKNKVLLSPISAKSRPTSPKASTPVIQRRNSGTVSSAGTASKSGAAAMSSTAPLPKKKNHASTGALLGKSNRNGTLGSSKSTPVIANQYQKSDSKHPPSIVSKGMVGNLNHNHMAHVGSTSSVGGSSVSDDSLSRSVAKDPSGSAVNFSNIQDKILFSKIKKGRMSTVDPRKLLPDEAARLEKGATSDFFKDNKRSTLLHDQAADMILEKLQNDCIFNSHTMNANGERIFPNKSWRDIPGLSNVHPDNDDDFLFGTMDAESHPPNPNLTSLLDDDFSVGSKTEKLEGATKTNFLGSPKPRPSVEQQWKEMAAVEDMQSQKVVSYETFQEMFKTYTSDAIADGLNSPDGKKKKSKKTTDTSDMQLPVAPPELDHQSSKSALSPGSPVPGNAVQSVDIVAAMKSADGHFGNFLKLQANEAKPSRKLISTSASESLTKPRKIRLIPPVGKSALDISHIRSIRKNGGFSNAFADMAHYKDEMKSGAEVASASAGDDSSDESEDVSEVERKGGVLVEENEDVNGKKSTSTKKHKRVTKPRSAGVASSTTEEKICPLQERIQAVHDALQLSTMTRIMFMHKYSSALYARELAVAVDIWGEIAVLAICRNETAKLLSKLQYGYCVMPLHHKVLLEAIAAEINPVLISNDPEYMPKINPVLAELEGEISSVAVNENGEPEEKLRPISFPYESYIHVRAMIRNTYMLVEDNPDVPFDPSSPEWDEYSELLDESEEPGVGAATEKQNHANLSYIANEIDRYIVTSLKKASDELDDIVCYGNVTCREWLMSLQSKNKPTEKKVVKKS